MTKRFLWLYQGVLFLLLTISLVSLSAAALYNRPLMDDLWQPYAAMAALRDGGSVWDALKAAFDGMADSFMNWNGVFFSMLLSYFPPMVFDYKLAFIHPIVIMLLLVGANFRLVFCVGGFNPDIPKSLLRIAAMLLSLMMLLLVYSVSEGFMWYSGAVNYTLMFALSLYLFSGVCSMAIRQREGRAMGKLRLIALCIGFFLLGGGNFSTSTVSIAIYGCFVIYCLLRGKSKALALPFAFLIAGYCLAVFAPGNMVRQAATREPLPLVQAFPAAFRMAYVLIFWDPRVWVCALLFLPFAIELSRYFRFEWRNGLILLVLSVALMAATAFPSVYATGDRGANRLMNIYFFLLYILVFINVTYLAGLAADAWRKRRGAPNASAKPFQGRRYGVCVTCYSLALAVVLFFQSAPNFKWKPFQFGCFLPPVKALSYLKDGELKAFADEYDAIVDEIRAHPEKQTMLTSQPWVWLFGGTELSDDPEAWQNAAFALYYGDERSSIAYRSETAAKE